MDNNLWIALLLYAVLSLYGYQAYRQWFEGRVFRFLYFFAYAAAAGWLMYYLNFTVEGHYSDLVGAPAIALGTFMAFLLFAGILSLLMLVEDVFRGIQYIMNHLVGLDHPGQRYLPARRKFLGGMGILVAGAPFGSMLYGMYRGRFEYRVFREVLVFEDLPEAFDGFSITQISDFHSGSYDHQSAYDREQVAYGIDLANQLRSDLVVFTGDMVNRQTSEMLPWSYLFSSLKGKEGKLSILGNHDYGDYREWDSEEAKAANLDEMVSLQQEMGFDLLRNEHRVLERSGQYLAIAGSENWGEGEFVKLGDLDAATVGLDPSTFTVLLSHDPSHWRSHVLNHPHKFALTLSGHTHGFQFGVEIPEYGQWSPVQYRYPEWAGLYEESGRRIYVNRGFGYIGYPGRVGIWPEITHIILKKKGL